jgi:hypothetical protein
LRLAGAKIYQSDEETAQLEDLVGHLPPKMEDYDNRGEYYAAYEEWKESGGGKWWKLWQVVPLVTREDTYGHLHILPQLRSHPEEYWTDITNALLDVPHLARLFETTRWTQQILTPREMRKASNLPLLGKEESTLIAEAKNCLPGDSNLNTSQTSTPCNQNNNAAVLGEKVLLAQANTGCFHLEISAANSGGQVYVTARFVSDGGDGDIWFFVNDSLHGHNPWNQNFGDFVYEPQWTGSPYNLSPGQSLGVKFSGMVSNTDACQDAWDTLYCNFALDATGTLTSDCGDIEIPGHVPAACLLPPIPSAEICFEPAISDPNPNDTLCAPPIGSGFGPGNPDYRNLFAVEEVENEWCNKDGWWCKDISDEDCGNCRACYRCVDEYTTPRACERCDKCPRNPPSEAIKCCESFTEDVYREIAFATLIPYLGQIYDQMSDPEQGFLNNFRPHDFGKFSEIAAKGNMPWAFMPEANRYVSPGSGNTGSGEFYFPWLGGAQLSKEWVSTEALMPFVQ